MAIDIGYFFVSHRQSPQTLVEKLQNWVWTNFLNVLKCFLWQIQNNFCILVNSLNVVHQLFSFLCKNIVYVSPWKVCLYWNVDWESEIWSQAITQDTCEYQVWTRSLLREDLLWIWDCPIVCKREVIWWLTLPFIIPGGVYFAAITALFISSCLFHSNLSKTPIIFSYYITT